MKTLFTSGLAAASLGLLIACSTPAPTNVEAKPDPRQGKEVKQICFSQEIRNWRDNGRTSIIVEKGARDEYKLDLVGACNPDQAFLNVAFKSRGGGSCLTWGDQLLTDSHFGGSCIISKIYEWHEKPKDGAEKK
jgi:hypothetical protein